MATLTTRPITAEEFAQLACDVPVELVRGEVLEMPRPKSVHALLCANLVFLLEQWNREQQSAWYVLADGGLITERDPDTVRGPDVMMIRAARCEGGKIPDGFMDSPPELCVEVRSSHDRWKEVITKVDEYLHCGVREVWVIEPRERQVLVFDADATPRTYLDGEQIHSTSARGLVLSVTDIYSRVPA
jgi:Uma2 family endonuclease